MKINHIKRIFQEPDTSYFLFGPRGTGKSTFAAMNQPSALLIDLRLHKACCHSYTVRLQKPTQTEK